MASFWGIKMPIDLMVQQIRGYFPLVESLYQLPQFSLSPDEV
jgi:hypothetical protein